MRVRLLSLARAVVRATISDVICASSSYNYNYLKYTSLVARVARLASPSEKLLTSAPVSRVVRVLFSREASASIGQSVARLARVPRADASRPERLRARETPSESDETRRETRATGLARVLERGTHEIFHRPAVDERGHEDAERGEESDRSRR